MRLGTIVPSQILKSTESTNLTSTLTEALLNSRKVKEWEKMIVQMQQNPETGKLQELERENDLERLQANKAFLKVQELTGLKI
tara:strand:+ start:210 stop:458 length:249 start_codon:yes stop_codon:yes gene_type:complete